ncbi:LOW QUALITY PROTEIN: vomeronasal type-1 receptor 90-like [Megaptera novaeangliae]
MSPALAGRFSTTAPPGKPKVSFYTHRVARVSLCTTCLLSGFQAITISPSNSRCAKLKLKAPTFLVNISAFLVACFPAFNPFVLISHDTQILRTYFCYLW